MFYILLYRTDLKYLTAVAGMTTCLCIKLVCAGDVVRNGLMLDCHRFCAASSGMELLIEYYQKEGNTKELPCRLEKPCAGGSPPPPLSLSCGYTNVLHSAISTGISDVVSDGHYFVCYKNIA